MSNQGEVIPEWLKKRHEPAEMPPHAVALYKDAKFSGSWIYDAKTRKFYTPDEFLEIWPRIYPEPGTRYSHDEPDIKIMNPLAAVRQRALWVEKAAAELQYILKKLEAYTGTFEKKTK